MTTSQVITRLRRKCVTRYLVLEFTVLCHRLTRYQKPGTPQFHSADTCSL